jgi:formylglycine-generating enzyme required for sulfatase activity
MTRGFWKDKERYLDTYWSRWENVWVHGDFAAIDNDGLWYILGRSDDTIKIAGKRLGPAEVESILVRHESIVEAAAIGVPHEVKGSELVLFAVTSPGLSAAMRFVGSCMKMVVAEMGKPLAPKAILFVSDLPKTRNAKVMRRMIRAAYLGLELGDTSSLVNPAAVEEIFVTAVCALVVAACAPTSVVIPTLPQPTQVSPSPEIPTEVPTIAPVELAGPQTGSRMRWVDGSVLMYVPAGDFLMGTGTPEAPQRTVTLDDYWIYQTNVTNNMYASCVAVGACASPAAGSALQEYQNPVYANLPMASVTWDMAANYCAWIGGGLPSEAQWEKAARGVSGAPYPWGEEEPDCALGNFSGCAGRLVDTTAYPDSASPFGVLDMAGNAFEWVQDYYDEPDFNNAPAVNPTGPESGEFRVVRGSSFESPLSQAAVATRRPAAAAFSSQDLGFRCVIREPRPLAPMCQLPSYIPASDRPVDSCQTPEQKSQPIIVRTSALMSAWICPRERPGLWIASTQPAPKRR